jgi:phosphoenolpyruvate carboxylase
VELSLKEIDDLYDAVSIAYHNARPLPHVRDDMDRQINANRLAYRDRLAKIMDRLVEEKVRVERRLKGMPAVGKVGTGG